MQEGIIRNLRQECLLSTNYSFFLDEKRTNPEASGQDLDLFASSY